MTVIDVGFDPDPWIQVFQAFTGTIGALAAVYAMTIMARERYRYIDIQRAAVGLLGGMLAFFAFDGDVMIGSHHLSALLTILMTTVVLLIFAWRGTIIRNGARHD